MQDLKSMVRHARHSISRDTHQLHNAPPAKLRRLDPLAKGAAIEPASIVLTSETGASGRRGPEAVSEEKEVEATPEPEPECRRRDSKALLTFDQVAGYVGFGRGRIYQLIKDRKFPAQIKIGKSARWRVTEIDAWIEELASKRDRFLAEGGRL